MKYLAAEKVNTGRQPEFDLLKGIGILMMILDHTFRGCAPESQGILWSIIAWYPTLFGLGVFIICAGIGMRYSRRQAPRDIATRGVVLLTIAQLVNLLRSGLPALAAFQITGKQIFVPFILNVFNSDVLTFFGLGFLLMALLKALKLRDGTILAIALGMNLLTTMLAGVIPTPEAYWARRLQSFFIVTDDALFPLGIHFVILAFGYVVGGVYPHIADKDAMANRVLMICVPISALYLALRLNVPFPMMPEYNVEVEPTMGLDSLLLCVNALILLSLAHKLCRLIGGRVPAILNHMSRHLNSYYCVGEVLIGCAMMTLLAVRGEGLRGEWAPFLLSLMVIAISYFCIEFNEKHLHFTIAGLQGNRRRIIYTAIWVASLLVALYGLSKVRDAGEIFSRLAL